MGQGAKIVSAVQSQGRCIYVNHLALVAERVYLYRVFVGGREVAGDTAQRCVEDRQVYIVVNAGDQLFAEGADDPGAYLFLKHPGGLLQVS